ncbi:unnamed protein product, partial [Effrenium voratum]
RPVASNRRPRGFMTPWWTFRRPTSSGRRTPLGTGLSSARRAALRAATSSP